MTAMRQLHPYEITNEKLADRVVEAINKFQQAICKNCWKAIYEGPFLGYEPDIDERSREAKWRHSRTGYVACFMGGTHAEPGGAPIVTLCGSTKFMENFHQVNRALSLQGNIVISLGLFGHSEVSPDWGTDDKPSMAKVRLDELHLRKIDLAHSIYVINVGGYIGTSTRREIEYAIETGKRVDYLEPI